MTSEVTQADLKPCPFCGGEARMHQWSTVKRPLWKVGCEACDVWLDPDQRDIPSCITGWNARSTSNDGWMPIESAPKFSSGGQLFLIFVPTATKRRVALSRGGGTNESWFTQGGYTTFDDRNNPVKATHWMPPPAPPSEGT